MLEPHRATPRNTLISEASFTGTRARRCMSVSDSELVTAPNLHEMTSGLSYFFAFGPASQCNKCNFVQWHKIAAGKRTRPWPGIGSVHPEAAAQKTVMSHALRIARYQQLVPRAHDLPGGDDGAERSCRFPEMTK